MSAVLDYWIWRVKRALGMHWHSYAWSDVKASLDDPSAPRASCISCGRRAGT